MTAGDDRDLDAQDAELFPAPLRRRASWLLWALVLASLALLVAVGLAFRGAAP